MIGRFTPVDKCERCEELAGVLQVGGPRRPVSGQHGHSFPASPTNRPLSTPTKHQVSSHSSQPVNEEKPCHHHHHHSNSFNGTDEKADLAASAMGRPSLPRPLTYGVGAILSCRGPQRSHALCEEPTESCILPPTFFVSFSPPFALGPSLPPLNAEPPRRR